MGKPISPQEDDYLGSVVLESSRFCPQGFEGELRLTGAGQGALGLATFVEGR